MCPDQGSRGCSARRMKKTSGPEAPSRSNIATAAHFSCSASSRAARPPSTLRTSGNPRTVTPFRYPPHPPHVNTPQQKGDSPLFEGVNFRQHDRSQTDNDADAKSREATTARLLLPPSQSRQRQSNAVPGSLRLLGVPEIARGNENWLRRSPARVLRDAQSLPLGASGGGDGSGERGDALGSNILRFTISSQVREQWTHLPRALQIVPDSERRAPAHSHALRGEKPGARQSGAPCSGLALVK